MNRFLIIAIGIVVILLAVMGPVIMAEKIEAVEVGSGSLVTFQELVTHSHSEQAWNNTTTTLYTPYREFNRNTDGVIRLGGQELHGLYAMADGSYSESQGEFYNDPPYLDYGGFETYQFIYCIMQIDMSQLATDNADIYYIWADGSNGDIPWRIHDVTWFRLNTDYTVNAYLPIATGPTGFFMGDQDLMLPIDQATENAALSFFSGYPVQRQMVQATLETEEIEIGPDTWNLDFQISPEYYEEEEEVPREITIWSNYTTLENVSYYTPHISQASNPFYLTRLMFIGSSGVLGIITFLFWSGGRKND